jgi:hypothetical protein
VGLAITLILTSCATAPALREEDVGRYLSEPTTAGTLMPRCGEVVLAVRARSALRDWFDIVSHTDACDLPQIRYQLSQRAAYTAALVALTDRADACGEDARDAERRVAGWQAELDAMVRDGVKVCGPAMITADARAAADRVDLWRRKVQTRVAADFPELRQR